MTEYVFSLINQNELADFYTLNGSEWAGDFTPEQAGEVEAERHRNWVNEGGKFQAFCLKEAKTGKIVSSVTVKEVKGLYKDADKSHAILSMPDPSLIGVKNVRFLLLGYVFTHKEHRKKGLAERLISLAIEHTENRIIQEKIDGSDTSKNDSFKNMVVTNGIVDRQLANYYLSKKYFWYLYSGVNTYYKKFGFKAYPMEFYKVPLLIVTKEQEEMIHQLLDPQKAPPGGFPPGKKLRLLHADNKLDQELISFIFQGKELEILTELNKLISHTELLGQQKSSSSLTNLTNILHMTKVDGGNSSTGLSAIAESGGPALRRKSSIVSSTVPKVAVKPDYNLFRYMAAMEHAAAKVHKDNRESAIKYTEIQGAVITNEAQGKSHYIIWATLMQYQFYVLSMGELKFEPMMLMDPMGMGGGPTRRRGSSFTGLNELGGYNFQDLDILINTACYVARNRHIKGVTSIIIANNDLPSNYQATVLHDYFLNYLPHTYESVAAHDDEDSAPETKVQFIDANESHKVLLPMLKKFGQNSPEFNLDWCFNGMTTWG